MSLLVFGTLVDCCEDGDELAGFVEEIGHLGLGSEAAVHEQFEPVFGFVNFLQAVAQLSAILTLFLGYLVSDCRNDWMCDVPNRNFNTIMNVLSHPGWDTCFLQHLRRL